MSYSPFSVFLKISDQSNLGFEVKGTEFEPSSIANLQCDLEQNKQANKFKKSPLLKCR